MLNLQIEVTDKAERPQKFRIRVIIIVPIGSPVGELTGTNWLLVEGRLCYLQAGVSDRSGGWRGRGPDLSRLFSDTSHPILEPPDPPIDSSRIQMPSYFCKLSEMCCSL